MYIKTLSSFTLRNSQFDAQPQVFQAIEEKRGLVKEGD